MSRVMFHFPPLSICLCGGDPRNKCRRNAVHAGWGLFRSRVRVSRRSHQLTHYSFVPVLFIRIYSAALRLCSSAAQDLQKQHRRPPSVAMRESVHSQEAEEALKSLSSLVLRPAASMNQCAQPALRARAFLHNDLINNTLLQTPAGIMSLSHFLILFIHHHGVHFEQVCGRTAHSL
jgi:hypothetical protein